MNYSIPCAVAPDGAPAIAVRDIRKSYAGRIAVDGLTFEVQPGEIFALLGPNGAGKTTTVEILEGYRRADSGTASILGLDPNHDSARLKPRVGVMLQEDGVYPGLTARELLHLSASYYAEPEDPDALLERVGLEAAAKTRCRRLSGGQKRRLALALAMIGRPELLFLDEPTTGMDPQARRATWELIREQRRLSKTVLLTTHLMDEAERLADRVAIIDRGRLVALDRPQALISEDDRDRVRFVASPGLDCRAIAAITAATRAQEVEPGVYVVDTISAADFLVALTAWLRDRHVALRELRVGQSSLEEVFLRLTGTDVRQ